MSVNIYKSRNVGTLVDRVKRTFGDMAGVQITNTDILGWINEGQREIAEEQKYNRTRYYADINAYQGTYVVSTAKVLSIESIRYDGKPLPYLPLAEAEDSSMQAIPYKWNEGEQEEQGVRTGAPSFWTLDQYAEGLYADNLGQLEKPSSSNDPKAAIYLWPVPDADLPRGLSLSVTNAPERVSSESEVLDVPDKYYNALVAYVLMQAYELDEDHEASQIKREEFSNIMLGHKEDITEEINRVYPSTTYYEEGW